MRTALTAAAIAVATCFAATSIAPVGGSQAHAGWIEVFFGDGLGDGLSRTAGPGPSTASFGAAPATFPGDGAAGRQIGRLLGDNAARFREAATLSASFGGQVSMHVPQSPLLIERLTATTERSKLPSPPAGALAEF